MRCQQRLANRQRCSRTCQNSRFCWQHGGDNKETQVVIHLKPGTNDQDFTMIISILTTLCKHHLRFSPGMKRDGNKLIFDFSARNDKVADFLLMASLLRPVCKIEDNLFTMKTTTGRFTKTIFGVREKPSCKPTRYLGCSANQCL